MEFMISLLTGIGLAATCGFRVFVPLLGVSIAGQADVLDLASGFEWMASTPALIMFSVASIFEVAAYYIPWVDNALDTIAAPMAVVAGTIITASVVGEISPQLRWSLALIAGGLVAGSVQAVTTTVRTASTAVTAGIVNPVVSTAELGVSFLGTLMTLWAPMVAVAVGILFMVLIVRWSTRKRRA